VHRRQKAYLEQAVGHSESAVIVNLDIRGFSEFSRRVDPVDAAAFLKTAYLRLLKGPFESATWFKPTGDGLLLAFRYEPDSVSETCQRVSLAAKTAIDMFPEIADGDPMVNFSYPELVGVGLARGSVARIAKNALTLDYSGRILNLASRLMDMARPRGLVIDRETFGRELVDPSFEKDLVEELVYVRGISEDIPRPVLCLPEYTTIDRRFKEPILPDRFVQTVDMTLKQMKVLAPKWAVDLDRPPRSAGEIEVRILYEQRPRAGLSPSKILFRKVERVIESGPKPEAVIALDEIIEKIAADGAKAGATNIRFELSYIPK
jgi:class 3 adenylate cyclase